MVIYIPGPVYRGEARYATVRNRPLRSPVRRIFSRSLGGCDDRKLRLNPAPATKIKPRSYAAGFWRLSRRNLPSDLHSHRSTCLSYQTTCLSKEDRSKRSELELIKDSLLCLSGSRIRPFPVADFRHVFTMFADVALVKR